MPGFKLFQFTKELVIFGIRNFRIGLDVVEPVVVLKKRAELGYTFGWRHRREQKDNNFLQWEGIPKTPQEESSGPGSAG